ncbi:NSFL1 cofactor p47 [Cydia pomonella]|uniref:NSFL1 cofactor p47 n=1 Tax=Cydia pomonella TaxID=82600 RepID=UPI002ADE1BA3|nr:NSFL1 cofactor p47 [Cydia pomonella]
MSANKEDTLRQFCDVTGADETRSRFFLESSNWQLDVALSSFYEHGGSVDEAPIPTATPVSLPTLSDSDMESPPASPLRQKKEKKKPTGNFATLGSLQQESSSDDDEGQAFYAGGSERSGQQIIGPGKNRKDIVTEMFKSVRERGAVVFEDEPTTASRGRGGAFSGTGYRLGQTSDDHEPVSAPGAQSQGEDIRAVRLRLYREGFTVDEGPVRSYTDPEHAEFLDSIRRGEIPASLGGAGAVRVSLEDRRHEPAPAAKSQAFAGKGQMLGSPTPPVVGAPAAVGTPAAAAADRDANTRAAQAAVQLDDTQPATSIQFRLADGSRVAGRFNLSHTVADLRQFVARAEPAYQARPFLLLTSYPSAELADSAATVQQANLANSTLLQRLK